MLFFCGGQLRITTFVGCHSAAFFFTGQLLHWSTFSEQLSRSVISSSSFHFLTFVNRQFMLFFLQLYFFGGQLSWHIIWHCFFPAQLSQLVNFMLWLSGPVVLCRSFCSGNFIVFHFVVQLLQWVIFTAQLFWPVMPNYSHLIFPIFLSLF